MLKQLTQRRAVRLITTTIKEWQEDNATRLAAALAYYTVFSIAPLLIIAISVAGLVLGNEAATGQLVGQIQGLIGLQGAELIETMIQGASKPSASIIATIIGIATLVFGATSVFSELQNSLNEIWDVKPQPQKSGLLLMVRTRFLSLTLVFGIGFLLLVSLVISAVLAGVSTFIGGAIGEAAIISQVISAVLSFLVTTLLFALMFKVLPDVHVDWHDVWIGAVMTSLLFSIGRLLIGLYLGNSGVTSTYGAAGSLIILLIWVYYSAQILFFGAEFTQVFARLYGSRRDEQVLVTTQAEPPPQIPPETDDVAPDPEGRKATLNKLKRRNAQMSTSQPSQPGQSRADVVGTVLGWVIFSGILLAGIIKGLRGRG